MSALADKIKILTAQEIAEGKATIAAYEQLKLSFANIQAELAEARDMIGDIPQLQAKIALIELELRDANEAADSISTINSAPSTPEPTAEVAPVAEPEAVAVVEPEPQTFEVVE